MQRLIALIIGNICCCLQIIYISQQYFEYDTLTQVVIYRPSQLKPPAIALCGVAASLTNTSKSTFDIFSSTPTASDLITKVAIHDTSGYEFRRANKSKLNPIRFYKNRYLCYEIKLHPTTVFSRRHLSNGYYFPIFYAVQFVALPLAVHHIIFYMHSSERNFYGISDSYAMHDRKVNIATGTPEANRVALSYSHFTSIHLPPPYKTSCLDYSTVGYESQGHCFDSCIRNLVLGRLPFTPTNILSFEEHASRLLFLKTLAPFNATMSAEIKGFLDFCNQKCSSLDCFREDFVPRRLFAADNPNPEVLLYAPSDPTIISTFKPHIQLVDFITYLLSCVSFWLAWSPVEFLSSLGKKCHNNSDAQTVPRENALRNQLFALHNKLLSLQRSTELKNRNTDARFELLYNLLAKKKYR